MVRLRTVSPSDPGWTRRRAGKGFVYLDQLGVRLPPEDRERCQLLVIPPAWEEVWICRRPNGHLRRRQPDRRRGRAPGTRGRHAYQPRPRGLAGRRRAKGNGAVFVLLQVEEEGVVLRDADIDVFGETGCGLGVPRRLGSRRVGAHNS